jgi:hypothetical protein
MSLALIIIMVSAFTHKQRVREINYNFFLIVGYHYVGFVIRGAKLLTIYYYFIGTCSLQLQIKLSK